MIASWPFPGCYLFDEALKTEDVADKLHFVAGFVGHLACLVKLEREKEKERQLSAFCLFAV